MLRVDHKRMGIGAQIAVTIYGITSMQMNIVAAGLVIPFFVGMPDIDSAPSKQGRAVKKTFDAINKTIIVASLIFAVLVMYEGYSTGSWIKPIGIVTLMLLTVSVIAIIKKNPFIAKQMGFITMHRGLMHTLVPTILFFFISLLFTKENPIGTIVSGMFLGAAIGNLVHLHGDICTYMGAPILYPLSKANLRVMWFKTSSETAMHAISIFWCGVYILLAVATIF